MRSIIRTRLQRLERLLLGPRKWSDADTLALNEALLTHERSGELPSDLSQAVRGAAERTIAFFAGVASVMEAVSDDELKQIEEEMRSRRGETGEPVDQN